MSVTAIPHAVDGPRYSSLLTDLSERGLLDDAGGVVVSSVTPKFTLKPAAITGTLFLDRIGRRCAGGIVRKGTLTRRRCQDKSNRASYGNDFHCLGHSPDTELHDTEGRPPISRGRVITEILS